MKTYQIQELNQEIRVRAGIIIGKIHNLESLKSLIKDRSLNLPKKNMVTLGEEIKMLMQDLEILDTSIILINVFKKLMNNHVNSCLFSMVQEVKLKACPIHLDHMQPIMM